MHNSGLIAKAVLRSGKRFSTLEEVARWERLNSLEVGDTFTFGNFPHDANGTVAPIEWQVLQRDDDGICAWWLRSPGGEAIYAAGVNRGGFISDYYVNGIGATVRPTFKIAL